MARRWRTPGGRAVLRRLGWLAAVVASVVVAVRYTEALYRFSYLALIVGAGSIVIAQLARRVRPSIRSMFWNAVATYAYIWIVLVPGLRWWQRLLLGGFALPLYRAADRSFQADARHTMQRRGERATELARRLSRGDPDVPRFALYLRPFHTTGRLPGQLPSSELSFDEVDHLDVETILTRAFAGTCEWVALGRPADIALGAGRIRTGDDDWKATVQRLMDAAAFIVIVPFAFDGTMWEIAEIRGRGHLGKTVFFMPEPGQGAPNGVVVRRENDRLWNAGLWVHEPVQHHFEIYREWLRAQEVLAVEGVRLPAYANSGAFFSISADGDPHEVVPAPFSVLLRHQPYLRAALARFGVLHWTGDRPEDPLDVLLRCAARGRTTQEYVLVLALALYAGAGDEVALHEVIARTAALTEGDPRMVNEELAGLAGLDRALRAIGPEWTNRYLHAGAPRSSAESLRGLLAAAERVPGVDRLALERARAALSRVVVTTGDSADS